MGIMQRQKGKRFERQIASLLRERWPNAVVRRASQAERADNPDVFVVGNAALERLWLECQDARSVTPLAKLEQAEWDIAAHERHRGRLPVAVTHQLGSRTVYATTRLWVLDTLRGVASTASFAVTLTLPHFLECVALSEAHSALERAA